MVALRKESVDRNNAALRCGAGFLSLSARRAWIEIASCWRVSGRALSLSARRAWIEILNQLYINRAAKVALRKESVDRNVRIMSVLSGLRTSLSARRAWIEISRAASCQQRNQSLSARRAWIEIGYPACWCPSCWVALRKESVDRNQISPSMNQDRNGRSQQVESG